MSDLDPITDVGDAWVHSGRTGLNTGSAAWVQVKSGERRGFLLPPLQPLTGRTVLAAPLVGRVGPGHVGQTYTVEPVTEPWSPGRVTWANQPAVNAAAAVTVTVGPLPDGGLVEIPLAAMLGAVAAGTEWHGVRITTDSTADGQKFYATDSGEPAWELLISLSDVQEQPTNLRPNVGAVVTSTPILAWDPVDLGDEETEQVEYEVQVDTPAVGVDPDDLAPDFYLTWETGPDPQFDLATSGHTPLGDGPHYWRVRTKGTGPTPSDWSDWAEYTVAPLPTVVVDSPVGAFGDPSPTLTAHTVEGDDVSWRAMVTGPDRSDVRLRSGVQTDAIVWNIPARNREGRRVLREDEADWIYLRVADYVDRAIAVGQNPFVEVWIPAEFDDDLGVEAPTGLTVEQVAPGDPRMIWSWSRAEAAEAWVLQVDGVTVARLEPEDVTAVAGTYTWTDSGEVSPLRPHQLRVRAVEGNQRSAPVTIERHTHTVTGVWLLPTSGDPIVLDGTAFGDWAHSDRVATYTPLEGPEVDVIYDYVGLTGGFVGSVDSRQDVWAALDRIEALRKSRNRTVRMVWGAQSITARIADLSPTSAEDVDPDDPIHNVRFRFVQVGD